MASDIYYGLSARKVKKFSFQYAMALNINILGRLDGYKNGRHRMVCEVLEKA
jgi:hypothetical protein